MLNQDNVFQDFEAPFPVFPATYLDIYQACKALFNSVLKKTTDPSKWREKINSNKKTGRTKITAEVSICNILHCSGVLTC